MSENKFRIEIRDFGPIKSFRFDLEKDLSLILGTNNIGKSYGIIATYIILKNLMNSRVVNSLSLNYFRYSSQRNWEFHDIESNQISRARLQKRFEQYVRSKDSEEVPLNPFLIDVLHDTLREVFLPSMEKSLGNSFDSIKNLRNKRSGKPFEIEICSFSLNFIISVSKKGNLFIKKIVLNKKHVLKKSVTHRAPYQRKDATVYYLNVKKSDLGQSEFVHFVHHGMELYRSLVMDIHERVQRVLFLPASRSGLYQALSAFSAILAELSQNRNFLTRKVELPNISEPVSDYFLNLSSITGREEVDGLNKVAESIEKDILQGRILFDSVSKKIVFKQDNIDNELDLSVSSSMISEIAPIVAYLKYIMQDMQYEYARKSKKIQVQRKTLIFIEEPEAHLHPEIQVKLMHAFGEMIGHNVKIVMTSHSNYMFNKLGNMILSGSIAYERVGTYLMTMGEHGSILDEDAMRADRDGMMDENFAVVTEQLYKERMGIDESTE